MRIFEMLAKMLCPGAQSPAEIIRNNGTTYDFGKMVPSEGEILRILEAGRWAQSPMNIQPWKFRVAREPKIVKKLMDSVLYGN